MTPRAITIRLAEPRDAQPIALMSRDFIEAGLGWKYDAARRFYRAMGFYETVLVPGYYRSGEGRKEGALRMLRVLRTPGPVPYTWRPPKTEDNT
jgi:hypothetical protein